MRNKIRGNAIGNSSQETNFKKFICDLYDSVTKALYVLPISPSTPCIAYSLLLDTPCILPTTTMYSVYTPYYYYKVLPVLHTPDY